MAYVMKFSLIDVHKQRLTVDWATPHVVPFHIGTDGGREYFYVNEETHYDPPLYGMLEVYEETARRRGERVAIVEAKHTSPSPGCFHPGDEVVVQHLPKLLSDNFWMTLKEAQGEEEP